MHPATPINEEYCHTSRASRSTSPSAPSDLALGGEPESGKRGEKRGRQDTHTEISSETHLSVNTDDTCDTGDEDPRPAKRQKPRSAPAVTVPLHVRRSHPLGSPSPANRAVDDAQPQHASRTSRSPSAATEAVPVAEYREWSFQGFFKRTKIGDGVTYNLEFQLPHAPEHFYLPISADAFGNSSNRETATVAANPYNTVAHSKVRPGTLQAKRKRVPWIPEENKTILKMKEGGCPWEEIHAALPRRTPGAIRVQYSTKLKK
jgi:hypothetical protein